MAVVLGSNTNNTLTGTKFDDQVFGLRGNDIVYGGAGNDKLYGGQIGSTYEDGNDRLFGEAGNDYLEGGTGNDYLDGGNDNDSLFGGTGIDTILGGNGSDYLNGGADNDTLNGGSGMDILNGGIGNDTLTGGFDLDWFVYNNPSEGGDIITDFTRGVDKIILSASTFGLSTITTATTTRPMIASSVFGANTQFYTIEGVEFGKIDDLADLALQTAAIVTFVGNGITSPAVYYNNGGTYEQLAVFTNGVSPANINLTANDFLIY